MNMSEESGSIDEAIVSPAENDDDDPVVHEIPIYSAQSLADSLFLFQYPLLPASTHKNVCPTAARFKPGQKKIQVDMPLQTNAMTYDRHKGMSLASACDGERPMTTAAVATDQDERTFDSDVMDKQTMTSSVAAAHKRYAMGILRGGEFHLTPVHAAVQLRPSFHYLDKGDAAKTGKGGKAGEDGEEEDAEEEKKQKTVTVRFARTETAQAKAVRLASYKHFEQESAKEKWVSVPVFSEESELSLIEREYLYCTNTGDSTKPVVSAVAGRDYLKRLCPEQVRAVDSNPSHPNDILSMTQLKKMPFKEQVRALLINAKVIQFNQLVSLLDATTQIKEVLDLLPHYAWLVRGCWVVKSDLLYPQGTCSAHSGVAAEILCKARDYAVWRFTQSRFVKRQDVTSVIKVPTADLNEIFQHLARIGRREGWEFCAEDALDFIAKHPSVHSLQGDLWATHYAFLSKELDIDGQQLNRAVSHAASDGSGRKRKKSFSAQTSVPAATAAVKDEPMDTSAPATAATAAAAAAPSSAAAGAENSTAGSAPAPRARARPPAPAAAAAASSSSVAAASSSSSSSSSSASVHIKAEPMDVGATNAVMTAPAAIGADGLASGAVVDAPPLIALVKRVIGTGVKTWRDIRQAVELEQACNPGTIDATVSDQAISKALIVAEAVELPASSATTDNGDRVYALSKTGDVTDVYRPVVLALFAKQASVSRRAINESVTKNVGQSETRELTRLLKEICMKQGNSWVVQNPSKS